MHFTMAPMQGKVIAITGGASGIGLATAKLLSSRGAILSLADIQQGALNAAASSIKESGGKVLTTVVDVTKSQEVKAWIEKTIEELGRLDGAANLAGVIGRNGGTKAIKDQDDEEWDFIMNVNARGVFNCLRAELNVMTSGAAIVNAASVAGKIGMANTAIYVASKFAVVGLTKSAAREAGPSNVRVNAIAPGVIQTPMVEKMEATVGHRLDNTVQAFARHAEPIEMATIIAFLLSDESKFVTGAIWSADGGWTA